MKSQDILKGVNRRLIKLRRFEIRRLYKQGLTPAEIHIVTGFKPQTIEDDIKWLKKNNWITSETLPMKEL